MKVFVTPLIRLNFFTSSPPLLTCTDSASMKAARCLAFFLTTKSKKKREDGSGCSVNADVPFLIVEVPVSMKN